MTMPSGIRPPDPLQTGYDDHLLGVGYLEGSHRTVSLYREPNRGGSHVGLATDGLEGMWGEFVVRVLEPDPVRRATWRDILDPGESISIATGYFASRDTDDFNVAWLWTSDDPDGATYSMFGVIGANVELIFRETPQHGRHWKQDRS